MNKDQASWPRLLCFGFVLFVAAVTQAQDQFPVAKASPDKTAAAQNEVKEESSQTSTSDPAPEPAEGKIARWFELQTATISARFLFSDNGRGLITANQLQHSEDFAGRFKFDAKARFSINAGLATGNRFTGGWNETGLGLSRGNSNLYLKTLYFSAQPARGLEIQYGSLTPLNGEASNITGFSQNGYLMGERINLRIPKLFFDEISLTYGYLGDLYEPGVSKRFYRLGQSNYHQFLVEKKIGQRAATSVEYGSQAGVGRFSEAIKINAPELKVVNNIRFENYQRLGASSAYGFAVTVEKSLHDRVVLTGGYAQIDLKAPHMNSESFFMGKRPFVGATFAFSPEFSISAMINHSVGQDLTVPIQRRFEVAFQYNLLRTLQRTGIF